MNELIKIVTERIKKLSSLREPPYELPADSFIDKASKDIIYSIFNTWTWISVKDVLPSHDQLVLAVPKNINCPAVLRFQEGSGSGNGYLFMWPDLKGQVLNISHWMPLPQPPKEESNDE